NVYATAMNEWLLAGGDQTQITKDIQNVLTRDSVMTYSANSIWQSLGVFKSSQNYVGSSPDAVGLMLGTSYPNPAYGPTTVPYTLDVAGPVEIGIYNTSGVEMERIVDGWQSAGPQRASFDASRLPSGAYLYRLTTSKGSVARPLVVEH
ncbi:MAG TPA: T9SS type A sorting domain-containing protein, partial [Candidatus Kapabacteria bacterium]|nr:T9SS type A sorting domain-containing protein [Candidatus Kapabacteria bacterium]